MKLSVNIHVAKLTGYYGLGTVLLFNMFGFYNLPLGPKSFLASPSLLCLPPYNSSKVF